MVSLLKKLICRKEGKPKRVEESVLDISEPVLTIFKLIEEQPNRWKVRNLRDKNGQKTKWYVVRDNAIGEQWTVIRRAEDWNSLPRTTVFVGLPRWLSNTERRMLTAALVALTTKRLKKVEAYKWNKQVTRERNRVKSLYCVKQDGG